MLKVVALLEMREDLSWDEFVRYWEEEHRRLFEDEQRIQKYTISPAIDPANSPYDGIAELYFNSTEDISLTFTDEFEAKIRADEEQFVDAVTTFVVAEQTQFTRM